MKPLKFSQGNWICATEAMCARLLDGFGVSGQLLLKLLVQNWRKEEIGREMVKSTKLAAIVCVGFLACTPVTAAVAEPQVNPEPVNTGSKHAVTMFSEQYFGDIDSVISTDSIRMTQGGRFIGRVDAHNAHSSNGDVSGHVSWTLISGSRRKMEVKSTLRIKKGWFGYSSIVSSKKVAVWPGGGRGKAAVARYTCRNSKSTEWYTYGEGFAPGTQKPWGFHESAVSRINCGV